MNSFSIKDLGTVFVGKDKKLDSTALDVPLIGLYFSAHWCPPCKAFTPVLADFYNKVNIDKKKLEIIFSSCDNDLNQFNTYFKTMPWIAFTYGDKINQDLSDIFNVLSIPMLIILNKDGKVLDKVARETVTTKGTSAIEHWKNL